METTNIYTVVQGVRGHCKVTGQGKPLLLLHGWGGEADSFLPVAQFFASKRKVYSLDFPGFGQSDLPPEPWSVTEYTDWMLEWMEANELTACDIIAHSFGGRVTILLSATHPERVGKLVLTGCAGIIPHRTLKYYAKVWSYKVMKRMAERKSVSRFVKKLGFDLEDRIRKRAGSNDYRSLSDFMRKTFVRVVNQDLRPCLRSIKASTLLIWGEDDTDTPLYFGKIMEKEIPDAGLIVFEHAGHFAYLYQLSRFNTIADHFLGGTP